MGKYVRTKDGKIYELQETKSGEKYLVKTNELIPLWNTNEYEIVKTSDTIEELCDYVFLYDSQNELVIIDLKKTNLYCLKGSLKDGSIRDVKLAILTDKGLIYVAKMNEKGELELL